MSEKEQKQWYVIRAIGGKEKKVKEYIETEVQNSHLEDYISQVLIPAIYWSRPLSWAKSRLCFATLPTS